MALLLALSTGPLGWLGAFGAGMLSFLSPCVLPLVPGYISLMSGVSAGQLSVQTKADTRQILRSTVLFVLGFTVVFVSLGAAASTVGRTLQDHQRGLEQLSGAVIVVMGLFLAGFISPRVMQTERRFHISPSRLGDWGAPVMGMAFAFGWTPCIGPVLGPILIYAATGAQLTQGILLLFFYSLGLGVPFVVTGLAFGRLTTAFAWVKRHYRIINLVSGVLLVAFGLLLFAGEVNRMSATILRWMERVGLDRLAKI
ncbi:MAG: cytochrome c-type biosis protein [Acidimicrobiaceae bacterium]|nr:cytochrome c-type biosis protein [Acidimicrobiaceae bacterium]MDQ1446388.1 cytochrome c-type biosis protein [Acidimicrobiaceae bacterium]